MKRYVAISVAVLSISLSCAEGQAELGPPRRSLQGLLAAKRIFVGRYVKHDSSEVRFVLKQQLRGKGGNGKVVNPLTAQIKFVEGKFMFRPPGQWFESIPVDVGRPTVWFAYDDVQRPFSVEPGEFADDYQLLLQGKEPSLRFRLLQDRDPDMRRDALERLYADRTKDVVESLHRVIDGSDQWQAIHAFSALQKTRTLDIDRFREKWVDHTIHNYIGPALLSADRDRFLTEELKPALARQTDPNKIARLLWYVRSYPIQNSLPIARKYINHKSEDVRQQSASIMYEYAFRIAMRIVLGNAKQEDFKRDAAEVEASVKQRLKLEENKRVSNLLTRTLKLLEGDYDSIDGPLPAYSDADELEILLDHLTSHGDYGFINETAGRELVEHYFDDGFAQMKQRLEATKVFNSDMVMDGIGYMRDPRCFEFLKRFIATHGVGHRCFPAAIQALGRQRNKESLVEYKAFLETKKGRYFKEYPSRRLFDGLAELQNEQVSELLRELAPHSGGHGKSAYIRALARHGDPAATDKLITLLRAPTRSAGAGVAQRIPALKSIDEPRVTEALKQCVETAWPLKRRPSRFSSSSGSSASAMENFSGDARRTNTLGEMARRDPVWLADLALRQMGSDKLAARQLAAAVFQQLTGHIFNYNAEAFAAERKEPLEDLQTWWVANREKSREEWLLAHFAESGFKMDRLHDRTSLPTLVAALKADRFTSYLAVEQISVVTGKYFCRFPYQDSYRDQEKMRIRVTGWLNARGYLK